MQSKSEIAYYKFLRLSHQVEDRVKKALRQFDLTHSQLNVLYLLHEAHPEPLNVKDMKKRMVVSQPDMTRLIDRLVKKGLVTRETCPENRRMIDILMTSLGQDVFNKAHTEGKRSTGHFFEDFLTVEEAVVLYKILNKIEL